MRKPKSITTSEIVHTKYVEGLQKLIEQTEEDQKKCLTMNALPIDIAKEIQKYEDIRESLKRVRDCFDSHDYGLSDMD